ADLAGFTQRDRGVRIVPHLRRQVEGDRQPRLALLEQEAVALVRLRRRAEAGVLAHRPQPRAVHRLVHAAREGILAGGLVGHVGRNVGGAVHASALAAPRRRALGLALLTAHAGSLTAGCFRASSAGWRRAWSSALPAWRTGAPGCRAARSPRRRSRARRRCRDLRTSRGTRGSSRRATPRHRRPPPPPDGRGCSRPPRGP